MAVETMCWMTCQRHDTPVWQWQATHIHSEPSSRPYHSITLPWCSARQGAWPRRQAPFPHDGIREVCSNRSNTHACSATTMPRTARARNEVWGAASRTQTRTCHHAARSDCLGQSCAEPGVSTRMRVGWAIAECSTWRPNAGIVILSYQAYMQLLGQENFKSIPNNPYIPKYTEIRFITETRPAARTRCRQTTWATICHVLLLLFLAVVRLASAQEDTSSDVLKEKAKALFPTSNDTLFVEDLEASRLAKTFAENVAKPIKNMIPRSYSATFVTAQMQVSARTTPPTHAVWSMMCCVH